MEVKKRLYRRAEITKMTGMSETTIRRKVMSGEFPRGYKLGNFPNSPMVWKVEDVEDWIEALQPV